MKKRHKKIKIFLIILLLGFIASFSYAVITNKISLFNNGSSDGKVPEEEIPNDEEEPVIPPKPKLKIIDLDSKTRPIAIMIDNEKGAWPQAGLQDTYIAYEIIVEGGITRILGVFKDQDTAKIGPIRSARHYFLDYALENDAIFTHFGFSPQAESDIKSLKVNNISGTQADGSAFTRDTSIKGWQNVFTSIQKLTARASVKKYRLESTAEPLLNYSVDPVDLSVIEGVKAANTISIHYSTSHYTGYEYDAVTKVYKRSMQGKPHLDRTTGLQYTFKNIIVYGVNNYPLNDGSGKGRQGLNNIGNGTGYYITEGYAVPIKWEKASRESKTIYTYLNGEEIKVNDGNTFIHLQPLNKILTIE